MTKDNNIINEAKKFYEEGGIQYALGLKKNKDSSSGKEIKQAIKIEESVEIKEPLIEKQIVVNEDNIEPIIIKETIEEIEPIIKPVIIEKEIKTISLVREDKKKTEEKIGIYDQIKIKEIVEESKQENNKIVEESTLLKEIKTFTENSKEAKIETIEIGDIFKKNEKLLKLLSNKSIKEDESGKFLEIDGKFVVYVGYFSFNHDINIDLLHKLDTDSNIGEFIINDFYVPRDPISMRKSLEKKYKGELSSYNIQYSKTGGIVKQETTNQLRNLEAMIKKIIGGDIAIYDYYSIVRFVYNSKEELLDSLEYIKILLQTLNLTPCFYTHLQFRVHSAFGVSGNYYDLMSLIKQDRLKGILSTHNELAGVKYTFGDNGNVVDKFYQDNKLFLFKNDTNVKGILLGEDFWTGKIINRDFRSESSYNTILTGVTGTGKSYTLKLICLREFQEGIKQIIIDPDGEFRKITQQIGGEYIDIGSEMDEKNKINPFDFIYPRTLIDKYGDRIDKETEENFLKYSNEIGAKFDQHIVSIKNLLNIILTNQKLGDEFYRELEDLIAKFFVKKGGIDKKSIFSYFLLASKPLNIINFYEYIIELYEEERDIEKRRILDSIKKGLNSYGNKEFGIFSKVFGTGKTGLNFAGKWTAFNLKNIGKDPGLKAVVVYSIMEFVHTIFDKFNEDDLERVSFVLDEATTFIGDNIDLATYIFELYKRGRKYRISTKIVVQGLDSLFVNFKSAGKDVNYGEQFIINTANFIILGQKKIGLDTVSKNLGLSIPQYNFLEAISSSPKEMRGVALVITGTHKDQIRFLSEEYIHKYITTDPNEKKSLQENDSAFEKDNN